MGKKVFSLGACEKNLHFHLWNNYDDILYALETFSIKKTIKLRLNNKRK